MVTWSCIVVNSGSDASCSWRNRFLRIVSAWRLSKIFDNSLIIDVQTKNIFLKIYILVKHLKSHWGALDTTEGSCGLRVFSEARLPGPPLHAYRSLIIIRRLPHIRFPPFWGTAEQKLYLLWIPLDEKQTFKDSAEKSDMEKLWRLY